MDITELQKQLSPILEAYGIERASVFGSVARGTAQPDSDIDLLVRLGKPMGMFLFMGLIAAMEQKLGRKVDLLTENSLNKFLKPHIERDLKPIYENRPTLH